VVNKPELSSAAAAVVITSGDIGSIGRDLDREQRGTVLDELYFEDDHWIPYLYRYAALMLFRLGSRLSV
jgi:hypothetical protein